MPGIVKERPILFAWPMVRAILEGRKTQTRRIVKLNDRGLACLKRPYATPLVEGVGLAWRPFGGSPLVSMPPGRVAESCPYGSPGEGLWVRETWRCNHLGGTRIEYKAGGSCLEWEDWPEGVLPPYEMPTTAHRVSRAERQLNGEKIPDAWRPSIHMPRWCSRITLEITGVKVERLHDISEADKLAEGATPEIPFGTVWRKINTAPGVRWEDNPWVWTISFKRIEVAS